MRELAMQGNVLISTSQDPADWDADSLGLQPVRVHMADGADIDSILIREGLVYARYTENTANWSRCRRAGVSPHGRRRAVSR